MAKTALSAEERAKIDWEISQRLCAAAEEILGAEPDETRTVMVYLPMPEEVHLDGFMEELVRRGVRIGAPRMLPGHKLECREYREDHLETGAWGIREPDQTCPVISPEEIHAVIVPGVAFDRSGNRLGHGAGYYDRFLAECPGKRIGVCRSEMLWETVPADEHDLRMSWIITEKEALRFDGEA